jgi:hypothetical protein
MIRKAITALAALFLVVGCTTVDPVTGEREPNRTANGAIIGAIVGAAAGTLAGGDDRRNAMIGAGIGALGGAAIGNYMDRTYQNLRERLAGTGINGDKPCEIELRPLIRILAGAFTKPPEVVTWTPDARPANCLSIDGVTKFEKSLGLILEDEPVKLFFCWIP